jgi:hypothetical protein
MVFVAAGRRVRRYRGHPRCTAIITALDIDVGATNTMSPFAARPLIVATTIGRNGASTL